MDNPTAEHRYRHDNLERAKQLRRDMTPAEVILWRELRAHRFSGYKFRRQQPIGTYIADFVCQSVKLIVELDGDSHIGREREDQQREIQLTTMGYKLIRFSNVQVYEEKETVLETIWQACQC